jgi:glyoxylase-like metal-dependent hydrolase (beta-lactamase superfamily II)
MNPPPKTTPFQALLGTTLLASALLVARAPDAAGQAATSPVTKINAAAAKAEIEVQPLRGNLSVLMGSGGNIGVFTSSEGKLMVDAGIAVSRPNLSRAIESVGQGQVKYVINTHWHWDHSNGNEWLQDVGATFIAHENTLKRLSKTIRIDDWDFTFKPLSAGARPSILVETDRTLEFGGETISMHYYGPCHTDTDIYVYFKHADVLFTGDTFWNGVYPFIDTATGGSIDGMIRAANTNIAVATDNTMVVSGHGPIGDRAQLIEYRDMLVGIRDNVSQLRKQGKSAVQAVAAKPTSAFDGKWGNFVIDPAFFTRLVYKSL